MFQAWMFAVLSRSSATSLTRKLVFKQLFQATWRGFRSKIEHLKDNLRRYKDLIESRANIIQFEEMLGLKRQAESHFSEMRDADLSRRRRAVLQWLSPPNYQSIHEKNLETLSCYPGSGLWLLDDHRFQKWFHPLYCSSPLLWLNGKPGAGM